MRKHYSPPGFDDDYVEILSADPVVRIQKELLAEIKAIEGPVARLHDDNLITFTGRNASYTYRIGDFDECTQTYLLSWPD